MQENYEFGDFLIDLLRASATDPSRPRRVLLKRKKPTTTKIKINDAAKIAFAAPARSAARAIGKTPIGVNPNDNIMKLLMRPRTLSSISNWIEALLIV